MTESGASSPWPARHFVYEIYNRRMWNAALPALKELNTRGIRFMVLKGLPQVEELYGHAGGRLTHDVDVLVSGEDAAETIERMRPLGWDLYNPPQYEALSLLSGADAARRMSWHLVRRDGTLLANIDLHSDGMDAWREPPLDAGIWTRAAEHLVDGVHFWLPSPEDRLAYLCWHFISDGFPWQKLFDIQEILRRGHDLDWQYVTWRARATGMTTVVWLVCNLAADRSPAPLEAHWASAALDVAPLRRALLLWMTARIHTELGQRWSIVIRTLSYDQRRMFAAAARDVLMPSQVDLAAWAASAGVSSQPYLLNLAHLYAGRLRRTF